MKTYTFETVESWIKLKSTNVNHFDDGAHFSDVVIDQILEASVLDFPDNPRPTEILCQRLLQRGAYDAALMAAERRLATAPNDCSSFFAKLAALVAIGELETAYTAFEAATEPMQTTATTDKHARQLLLLMLGTDAFKNPELKPEKIFFAHTFARKIPLIRTVAKFFTERFFFDYLSLAQSHVRSRGARFIYVSIDDLFVVANKSETEETLLAEALWKRMGERPDWLKSLPPHMEALYGDYPEYSQDYINQIFTGPSPILQATKVVLSDYSTDYVNVVDNKRVTLPETLNAENKLYVFGGSDVYGFGADDARTIPSYLQKQLNRERPCRFSVENHSLRGNPLPICVLNLMQTQVNEGDVVVLFGYPRLANRPAELDSLETMHVDFSRPHDYGEVFFDHSHCAPAGNKVIADKITKTVLAETACATPLSDEVARSHPSLEFLKYLIYRNSADVAEAGCLKSYVEYVTEIGAGKKGNCGSVAVNCNPMTLGHLHLLEYAAAQVDHLFVFVIEEDLSFFPFADRLKMVEDGLAHLTNVTVLKGGRYICTQLTFPEYFSKDDANHVKADASMEAWFFCEYIAKALNISIIFLGDEPTCNITRQYNAKMLELLPKYSIKVDIIPRIALDGNTISASHVRELLKVDDFDGIAKIVPETTHAHLLRMYGTQ